MKRVVIDTNVMLIAVSKKSKDHWIIKALFDEKYELCVTTDILMEYEEIIGEHMGVMASVGFMKLLSKLDNIVEINTFFNFRLLRDEDDDKFVDCAIVANAHFIVSHDKDFRVLKNIEFPKVHVIDTEEFKRELNL